MRSVPSTARVASRDGRGETIRLHQDVDLYVTLPGAGDRRVHALAEGRHAWVQVAKGAIRVNGTELDEGDGASVSQETRFEIEGREPSEVLVFDLG